MDIVIGLYLFVGALVVGWIGWTASVHDTAHLLVNPDYLKPHVLPWLGLAAWLLWGPLCLSIGLLMVWIYAAGETSHSELCCCADCEAEADHFAALIPEYENRPVPPALLRAISAECEKVSLN